MTIVALDESRDDLFVVETVERAQGAGLHFGVGGIQRAEQHGRGFQLGERAHGEVRNNRVGIGDER